MNHNAWSSNQREWSGTSGPDGRYTWNNLDKGTLGDRYTFTVVSQDPRGGKWTGEVSDRITTSREYVVVLAHEQGN